MVSQYSLNRITILKTKTNIQWQIHKLSLGLLISGFNVVYHDINFIFSFYLYSYYYVPDGRMTHDVTMYMLIQRSCFWLYGFPGLAGEESRAHAFCIAKFHLFYPRISFTWILPYWGRANMSRCFMFVYHVLQFVNYKRVLFVYVYARCKYLLVWNYIFLVIFYIYDYAYNMCCWIPIIVMSTNFDSLDLSRNIVNIIELYIIVI